MSLPLFSQTITLSCANTSGQIFFPPIRLKSFCSSSKFFFLRPASKSSSISVCEWMCVKTVNREQSESFTLLHPPPDCENARTQADKKRSELTSLHHHENDIKFFIDFRDTERCFCFLLFFFSPVSTHSKSGKAVTNKKLLFRTSQSCCRSRKEKFLSEKFSSLRLKIKKKQQSFLYLRAALIVDDRTLERQRNC